MSKTLLNRLASLLGGPREAAPADEAESIAWVRSAYLTLLQREPDADGQQHWVDYLRQGGSYKALLTSFVRSKEFKKRLDIAQMAPEAPVLSMPEQLKPTPSTMVVVGNCQSDPIARCLQAYLGGPLPARRWVTVDMLVGSESARAELARMLSAYERVFMQPEFWNEVKKLHPEAEHKIVLYPSVAYFSFHPDLIYIDVRSEGRYFKGPLGDYNSAIALLGWQCGLTIEQTLKLYCKAVFQRVGFFDWEQISRKLLLEEGERAGMPLDMALKEWSRQGCFMHASNHPKLLVMADITRRLIARLRLPSLAGDPTQFALDSLAHSHVWPVYPEIAEHLGVPTQGYCFKQEDHGLMPGGPVSVLNLREFVSQSFEAFSRYAKDDLTCPRLESTAFKALAEELRRNPAMSVSTSLAQVSVTDALPAPTGSRAAGITNANRFGVLGNCQSGHMARCLQAFVGGDLPPRHWLTPEKFVDIDEGRLDLEPFFAEHDYIFVQPWIWERLSARYGQYQDKIVMYPAVGFVAYQPDLMTINLKRDGEALEAGPAGRCHSSLAFLAWHAGLDIDQAVALFNGDTYKRLKFYDWWWISTELLREEGIKTSLPLEDMLAEWSRSGCFMHCHVHPQLRVVADIARLLLRRLGVPIRPGNAIDYVDDYLENGVVWPVYPEIAEALGCGGGSYFFKRPSAGYLPDHPVEVLDLKTFVAESYAAFSLHAPEEYLCERIEWPAFVELLGELRQKHPQKGTPAAAVAVVTVEPALPVQAPVATDAAPDKPAEKASTRVHPYQHLPAHHFWRLAVEKPVLSTVDPVVRPAFSIQTDTRVATAGSCFAQHISRRLADGGFHFLKTEAAVDGADDDWYSARYGNLYTARQLLQLFDRAYGQFDPQDRAWLMDNGHYADPFRPQIEAGGFVSIEALEAAREPHLAAVRRMFETLDVFVFTLGLTETWCAKADGAVFPLAPGVAAGVMDAERYAFFNFTAAEVLADLEAFVDRLLAINPGARLLFTVSPVPLMATYADQHVLVSTTYSKAVLRVAVDDLVRRRPACAYFPSYEIITGNFNRGRYYAEDLRSVKPEGVDHVMRLFFQHYAGLAPKAAEEDERMAEARRAIRIICDEELLAAPAAQ